MQALFFSTYVILVGSLSIVPLFESAVAVFFPTIGFFCSKKNRKFLAISSLFFHFKAIELNTKKSGSPTNFQKIKGLELRWCSRVEARCGGAHLKCCVVGAKRTRKIHYINWAFFAFILYFVLYYTQRGADSSRHFLQCLPKKLFLSFNANP